jgi:subtilisin family serine protease
VGHGTHTASTAAGAMVPDADCYGLAKGGAPASRVAVYRACSLGGCASSAVLKAIEYAVADGVDVVSIGIGSAFQKDFLSDPIALGAFHAQQSGVLIVCSGGNDGPRPDTVVNTAPWILTVAASSIDRTFQSTIALGNGTVLKVINTSLTSPPSPADRHCHAYFSWSSPQGVAINFSNQSLSGGKYPLVFGAQAAAQYAPVAEARYTRRRCNAATVLTVVITVLNHLI